MLICIYKNICLCTYVYEYMYVYIQDKYEFASHSATGLLLKKAISNV